MPSRARQMRAVFESIPGSISEVGLDRRIRWMNRRFEATFGVRHEKAIGRDFQELGLSVIGSDGRPLPFEEFPVSRAIATGKPQGPDPHDIRLASGRVISGLLNAFPMFDPATRTLTGVVTMLIDVTGQREAERERHGATVRLKLAPVPETLADPNQMYQVFTNLVINALEAMDGPEISIRVSDTGSGIAPEILSKLFDPFFTTKARDQGTGLGLAIVHTILRDHGGRIDVSSTPGEGSVFEVVVPVRSRSGPEPA